MKDSYWNTEDEDYIKCPYCGETWEPSYEDTYIGGECVNCFSEEEKEYVCDDCGKKFILYGYQSGWKYHTRTIDGQMTEKEHEEFE